MQEEIDSAERIKRLARSLKIWCISIDRHTEGHTERVWWFKRPGEDVFAQRDLADKEAITWLRDESCERLRKLKLHD